LMVSRSFVGSELQCRCCGNLIYEQSTIDLIQELRDELNIRFRVNSFYRCKSHNQKVGGGTNSQHLYGRAMDISTEGWKWSQRAKLVKGALNKGLSVGIYRSFVHVDNRIGEQLLWYGSS